jgi:hypothetical protein
MGALSPIAQHLVVALEDSSVRVAVARAMKQPQAGVAGLDLQGCASDPVVSALLASGEKRGGAAAKAICSALEKMNGAILYMDPTEVKRWDGTTIPIVTARATLSGVLPKALQGYRSPDRLIAIPTDGSMSGPILVVLPIPHPTRLTAKAMSMQRLNVTRHPVPTAQTSP